MWLLVSLFALVAVVAIALIALTGRPVDVPEWVGDRVEDAIALQFPEMDVTIGNIAVVVEDGFSPRIRARDLSLRQARQSGALDVDEVDVILSGSALVSGQIVPERIHLSGMFLALRRMVDGSFNVSVGTTGETVDTIEGREALPGIGRQIAQVLNQPALKELSDVSFSDVRLRYEDMRVGQGWTIDGGRAVFERSAEDVSMAATLVALSARSYVSSVEMRARVALTSQKAEFSLTFEDMPAGDIATQSAALAFLEIVDAPISGSIRTSTDETGTLGPTNVALQIGAGVLQPNPDVSPIPFESAYTYLTYDPDRQALQLSEFSVQADLVRARASGKVLLRDFDLGLPNSLISQLRFSQLEINPNLLEDSPVSFDDGFADFRLRLDPFRLDLGQLLLDEEGQRLAASGHLDAGTGRWGYAVDGQLTGLALDKVLGVWPETASTRLRTWIATNMLKIKVSDVNFALRSTEDKPNIYADFSFEDLDLKFMKTMPPIREASGVAMFLDNQFRVGAEGGYIEADQGGKVDITGTSFAVLDTRVKPGPAEVRLALDGPVTAVMSLLNRKPLQVMDKARLPVDLATGNVRGSGKLNFTLKPKLPPNELFYRVGFETGPVETTHFIKDKVIAAKLTGLATHERVVIEGIGKVGDVPVEARWEARVGPDNNGRSVLTGYGQLDQVAVDEFNVGFPDGTFSGASRADFEMVFQRGTPPRMTLVSDLDGLGVSLPPLGWRKPQEGKGALDMVISLEQPVRIPSFTFEAAGLAASGNVSLRDTGGLDAVTLDAFSVGSWLSGTGAILGRGEGAAPAIEMTSGRLDVRGLPSGDDVGEGGDTPTGPITATLERVDLSDSYYLSSFSGQFEDIGGLTGDFSGLFNGQAPIRGEMVPSANGPRFRVQSEQGGEVITQLGFAEASPQGALLLHLTPDETGILEGVVAVQNVKIQNAPAFAGLLNAVSVVGLLEQLNGPGILMGEITAKFRLEPDRLVVNRASATGPAMGLSLDGIMDLETNAMNFQGAFSPVYILNSVGQVVSKKGEGLIAFTYTLRGTPDDMQIVVNPLSALTPGFFREIFRTPSETDPAPPARSLTEETDSSQGPELR